ncbi:hypothetical protein HDU97_006905 [Phlyctochytrium planicorne]|nr:hypothetical protein HDU97_006905 [Phlyctochytrium planicorne]
MQTKLKTALFSFLCNVQKPGPTTRPPDIALRQEIHDECVFKIWSVWFLPITYILLATAYTFYKLHLSTPHLTQDPVGAVVSIIRRIFASRSHSNYDQVGENYDLDSYDDTLEETRRSTPWRRAGIGNWAWRLERLLLAMWIVQAFRGFVLGWGAHQNLIGWVSILAMEYWTKMLVFVNVRVLTLATLSTTSLPPPTPQILVTFSILQLYACFADFTTSYRSFSLYAALIHAILAIAFASTCISLFFAVSSWNFGSYSRVSVTAGRSGRPWREFNVGVLGRLSFSWLNPLILTAMERGLGKDDLWDLDENDRARVVYTRYRRILKTADIRKPGYTIRSLIKLILPQLIFEYSISLVDHILLFMYPLQVHRILEVISSESPVRSDILTAVFYLFLVSLGRTACESQLYWINRRIDVLIRNALVGAVFEKSLRRRAWAGTDSSGTVSNLITADADKIMACFRQSHYVLSVPVLFLACFGLLVQTIGLPGALAGLTALALAVPATNAVGKRIKGYKKDLLKRSDERMSRISELLSGIKTIKIYAWESIFESKLQNARIAELSSLSFFLRSTIATQLLWRGSPLVASAATFLVHSLASGTTEGVDPATAFTVLTMFNNVLRYPLFVVPKLAISLMEAKVSVQRLETFLGEVELERYIDIYSGAQHDGGIPEAVSRPRDGLLFEFHDSSDEGRRVVPEGDWAPLALGFEGDATFDYGGGEPVLRNLNLALPTGGSLTVVFGPTGCGKTSLLLALLGELRTVKGTAVSPLTSHARSLLTGPTPVSYVSQQSWLQNTTLRDNVVFGTVYERQRYIDVMRLCALDEEFGIALRRVGGDGYGDSDEDEWGDLASVGENGGNLSGGQRQRLCLARALYSHSPILLLDDTLSAVDAKTAMKITNSMFSKSGSNDANHYLTLQRTIVLVAGPTTLDLCLPFSTHIVLMRYGGIVSQTASTEDFLNNINKDPQAREALEEAGIDAKDISGWRSNSFKSRRSMLDTDAYPSSKKDSTNIPQALKAEKELENTSTKVDWSVYRAYFTAGGLQSSGALIAIIIIAYLAGFFHDYSLKEWSSPSKKEQGSSSALTMYTIAAAAALLLQFVRFAFQARFSLRASKVLHTAAANSLLGAPLSFFEKNPAGRVLNRFGKDVQVVDQEVVGNIGETVQQMVHGAMILLLMVGASPILILGVFPIAALYYPISTRFLAGTRSLKRLEASARSPIYSSFNESIAGITTIRTFGRTDYVLGSLLERLDDYHKAFLPFWGVNRWLAFRVEIVGALVAFFAGVGMTFKGGFLDAGWFGLCLNYAGMVTDALTWLVRNSATLEISMTSVERIQEYISMRQEPPRVIRSCRPPPNWPGTGQIRFDGNLQIRYSPDLPPAISLRLETSSLVLGPGSIGLVGRTGSGKTTLGMAVLRLVEPSMGRLSLDSIDVGEIGIEDIRRRICVVPQEAFLFKGSVRENLDPLKTTTDSTLLSVLSRVGISDSEANLSLDTLLDTNSSNLSSGQRQLLSVARVLVKMVTPPTSSVPTAAASVRGGGLLIMDEATSNMDPHHEAKAMEAIAWAMSQSSENAGGKWSMLVIAHRVSAVMGLNRVIVMGQRPGEDGGTVVEDGEPKALMRQGPGGAFFDLVSANK